LTFGIQLALYYKTTTVKNSGRYTDERKICIEVRTLEWLSQHKPEQLISPKKPGYMEIIWITKAEGTCMIDLERLPIKENEIYCIGPGQLRDFQTHDHLQGYYLLFATAFIKPSVENACPFFRSGIPVATKIVLQYDEAKSEMEQLIRKMVREFSLPFEVDVELMRGLLLLLLIYLAKYAKQEAKQPNAGRPNDLLSRFLLLIEKNYNTNKMPGDYAAELCVSASYLNSIVKGSTGYPTTFHIQQRKIMEAKKQIVWHGMSLKEAAYQLGFADSAHFSKFFKAKAGMTYQHFRRSIQISGARPVF
jgi:AraC family transcriptional regulator, transcriptional activator of pobA